MPLHAHIARPKGSEDGLRNRGGRADGRLHVAHQLATHIELEGVGDSDRLIHWQLGELFAEVGGQQALALGKAMLDNVRGDLVAKWLLPLHG